MKAGRKIGHHVSEETRKKLSKKLKGKNSAMKGKHHSSATKKKISLSMKGKKNWLGKKHTNESKLKMSMSRKGRFSGKNSPSWLGGKSFEPYNIDWTKTLKRSIKERDNYQCKICGNQPEMLQVHHIDYNKKNCNPNNLITLCASCHTKTNFNREKWIKYFKVLIY